MNTKKVKALRKAIGYHPKLKRTLVKNQKGTHVNKEGTPRAEYQKAKASHG